MFYLAENVFVVHKHVSIQVGITWQKIYILYLFGVDGTAGIHASDAPGHVPNGRYEIHVDFVNCFYYSAGILIIFVSTDV